MSRRSLYEDTKIRYWKATEICSARLEIVLRGVVSIVVMQQTVYHLFFFIGLNSAFDGCSVSLFAPFRYFRGYGVIGRAAMNTIGIQAHRFGEAWEAPPRHPRFNLM